MLITFLPWFVQLLNTDVMVKQSRIQNIVTETDLIGTCVIVALSNSLRRENHVLRLMMNGKKWRTQFSNFRNLSQGMQVKRLFATSRKRNHFLIKGVKCLQGVNPLIWNGRSKTLRQTRLMFTLTQHLLYYEYVIFSERDMKRKCAKIYHFVNVYVYFSDPFLIL